MLINVSLVQVTRPVVFIPSRTQTPAPIFCIFVPGSAFKFLPSLGVRMRQVIPVWQGRAKPLQSSSAHSTLHGHCLIIQKCLWKNESKVQLWGMITLSASFKHIISFLSADYNNSWAATVIFWMEGREKCDPVIKQSSAMLTWAKGLGWGGALSMCD